MRRVEEILEIAEILDETADKLASVLERSGADKLHPPETLLRLPATSSSSPFSMSRP